MLERGMYGELESNPITDEWQRVREEIDHKNPVDLTDPRLARITRLRLVSDPGFPYYDLSYCYGELNDGTPCRVDLPMYSFSKRYLKRDLVAMCKAAKVYGKALGILDDSVISLLT